MQLDNYKNLKKVQNLCDLGKCRDDSIWGHCQIEGKMIRTFSYSNNLFLPKTFQGLRVTSSIL